MAAAAVLNPSIPSTQANAAAFSPITLFECTISNASMLVDSMPVRDLMTAFRIVSQLNAHLVEVMDPQVNRLADSADQHQVQQQQQQHQQHQQQQQLHTPVSANHSHNHHHHHHKTPKSEFKRESIAAANTAPTTSDEDCLLMEDEFMGGDSSDLIGSGGGSALLTSYQPIPSAKRSKGPDLNLTGELSTEWKGILRKAYRELKDESSSNVFDFSLPYSAPVNKEAASMVIEKARSMTNFTPNNLNSWTKMAEKYTKLYYLGTLRKMHREKHRPDTGKFDHLFKVMFKLNRRQKAYETLKGALDSGSRTRFEAILNRDYTSSDEESPSEPDGQLRVKQLPWESEELRAMKRRLDEVFYETLADEKQRAEVDRVRRDGIVASSRLPPSDGFDWAKVSECE